MDQIKKMKWRRWIKSREGKAGKIIIGFLALALLFTYVSRFASSVITPQVSCDTMTAGTIKNEVIAYGVVEVAPPGEEGYRMQLSVSALEQNYIKKGDEASVYSYEKNKSYPAKVLSISQNREDPTQYDVSVSLPKKGFYEGLNTDVTFVHESVSYDCVLPWSAVRSGANGTNYVLIAQEEQTILGKELVAKRVGVKLEEGNDTETAVDTNGLSEDDLIIIDSNKKVEAGDSVRIMQE